MECNNKNNLLKYEKELWEKGYIFVCGIDEVGRGCIAGPLVAAAVILPKNYFNSLINDSKLLNEKTRIELANEIKNVAISFHIEFIKPAMVDKLNPKQASKYAMMQCIKKIKIKPDFLLIDYEFLNTNIQCLSIVKGDQKSQSIAAASIIAKVARDQYMIAISKKYSDDYDFIHNKGYLTKKHLLAIEKNGPIKHFHRFSYNPIKIK